MILDPRAFIAAETPAWDELDALVRRLESVGQRLDLDEAERFHHLYLRAGSGLSRLGGLSAGQATRERLEQLLARAHAVSSTRRRSTPFDPWAWAVRGLPRAFQRRVAAFWVALGLTLLGALAGAGVLAMEPRSKPWLLPFSHLQQSPSQRVAQEEQRSSGVDGHEATFASQLMTHNLQVCIYVFALGLTLGLGTLLLTFYNGMLLGAVCWDYLMDSQGRFLAGWLLPHGSVEIPAVLLAAQAGLVLGAALVARAQGATLRDRVRAAAPDLLHLLWGVLLLLVWAGIIESYLSQVHEPRIPYEVKWGYGALQLALLTAFLFWPRRAEEP